MTESKTKSPTRYYGLPNGAAKAYFVCQKYLNNGLNALFVTASDTDDFDNAAREFAPRGAQTLHLPDTDTGRMNALYELLSPAQGPRLLSCSYEVLSKPLPDPNEFQKRLFIVRRGDTQRRQELLDRLEAAGYTREDYAETPGQYAARGSVVDIFCLNRPEPLRLYFAGNRVEMISAFDLDTQNTKEHTDQAVILPLPACGGAVTAEKAEAMIAEWMPRCGAAAIGPGMGRGEEAGELFSWFWNNWRAPLLVDADMLYFFARDLDALEERDNVLLTPHGGEAARILGVSAAEVGASREKSARALTKKAGYALLKGRNTLIASSSGELRMIAAGSSALAVPGSGDVLSGVAGALMASGLSVMDAATAAALAHGAAGERLAERADEMLRALGTTSPSYVLLASLESCVDGAAGAAAEYDRLKRFSDELRGRVPCLPNDDFTRIAVDVGGGNGRRAAYEFFGRGIIAEKYDERYVVFILTPFDTDAELRAFRSAAEEITDKFRGRRGLPHTGK